MRCFISSFIVVLIILSVSFSCKKQSDQLPDKGVSFALNEHRKKTIDSIHYALELDIPESKKEAIKGKELISFLLKNTSEPVTLDFNADSSNLISVKVKGKDVAHTFANEHIVIEPSDLEKGRNEVEIEFVAGDMSLNRSEEYLYTLFVPDRASTCFPLFDQPNLKATYSLTLKTPASWEAVANGLLKDKKSDRSKSIYQFEKTKPISSYLFAFSAGKFFKTVRTIKGREMTMYYRETDTTKVNRNADEVFRLHGQSLAWLEDYTDIKYPFGKFDFVLIPSFQYGGMEHPGAIFYNESGLFLDENASVNKKMARASVIAHESAHMWFGDLVTMDWFNDVWLKEVFANFMAAKIVHPSFPEINHDLRFLLAHYPSAYEVDRSAGTNPILQELGNLKNAGTLYGAIIYQKAPIVMRQLERKIGEKMMQESLQEYLKTYSFGNARWDDLIGIIDKKTPLNIAEWSNVWVKTSGMPEYELISDNKAVSVKQLTDSISGRIWQQSVNSKWKVGDAYRESSLNLVNDKSLVIGDAKSMVFPNSSGIGYGYFKMDSESRNYFAKNYSAESDPDMTDPVFRGAILVNIWEGFLRGDGQAPQTMVSNILGMLPKEENPLLVDYLLGNLQTLWWSFLPDVTRQAMQVQMETQLWELLNATKDKGIKTSYFKAFKNVALSDDGLQKLESLWNGKLNVKDLVLSEDDKISLACEITLKGQNDPKQVLETQLNNTKNPDRKQKLAFAIPALSKNEAERDAFFESLKKPENREKEAWVLEGLSYLHHPLRQKSAVKYLRPSLEMLQEIQLTGDIFFPTRWMHNTFAGHSGIEAKKIADAFLTANPNYPFYLKNKVLQAIDMLDRAVKLKR
ncbi:M1 family aminopeptidase [Dyadobacter sp. CY312]|uniref:M1 family metallopeptidase n=1 Tax=Dyadobacter sp. CY312 TaxID=2907303 RepID=UPI001F3F6AAC|nr:M1 family aminopeptidase [Dyadobacter sp. CY312]MCE7039578.1 M1 family aminopeptidase [Dyadobacter sp. CY312]